MDSNGSNGVDDTAGTVDLAGTGFDITGKGSNGSDPNGSKSNDAGVFPDWAGFA